MFYNPGFVRVMENLEFYIFIFQAWSIMEFRCGSRKVMENQCSFYERKAIRFKIEKLTDKSKNQI